MVCQFGPRECSRIGYFWIAFHRLNPGFRYRWLMSSKMFGKMRCCSRIHRGRRLKIMAHPSDEVRIYFFMTSTRERDARADFVFRNLPRLCKAWSKESKACRRVREPHFSREQLYRPTIERGLPDDRKPIS